MKRLAHHLLSLHADANRRAELYQWALFLYAVFALVGIVLFSPWAVIALTIVSVVGFFALLRPLSVLTGLLWYLPFEPFLLKWVPDELYVYARYGSELLVYGLFLSAFLHRLNKKEKSGVTPSFVLPGIALLAVIVLSVLVNAVPAYPALMGARMILRFILFVPAVYWLMPSRAWWRVTMGGLGVIALIQVLLGFGQTMLGAPLDQFLLPTERRTLGSVQLTGGTTQYWDPGSRIFGTMGRYDQLGAFLALALLFICSRLYFKVGKEEHRLWLFAALFVGMFALALTLSRSAWIGFVMGFLMLSLCIMRDRRVAIAGAILVVTLATYGAVEGVFLNRITETSSQTLVERALEVVSIERFRGEYYGLGRAYWIYQTFVTVIPSAPIFGVGPASFGGGAVAALGRSEVYDQLGLPFGVYGTEGYIDNNWLSLWGELGTVGLAAYVWLYVGMVIAGMRQVRVEIEKEVRAQAAFTAAAFTSVAVNAGLATMLEVRTLAPYIWVAAGVLMAWKYADTDGA